MTYLTPVQMMYRTISTPSASSPKPAPITAPKTVITRALVDEVIQRRRSASAEELEEILATEGLKLTDGERNQVSVELTVLMAQRARNEKGCRDDPNEEFIAKTLGLLTTPWGLLERSFITQTLRDGAANIQRCRLHRPPMCDCWSAQRAILWDARAGGEKTPEGWAARRLFDALENLETASRPERREISAPTPAHDDGHYLDSPNRSRWPTRTDGQ